MSLLMKSEKMASPIYPSLAFYLFSSKYQEDFHKVLEVFLKKITWGKGL